MKRSLLIALLLAALTAILYPVARERWRLLNRWGDYTGYNVLLITLDTTRADFLSCYNRGLGPMPGMEGAAEGAIVFEAATAPTTTTVPSHASILTGVYPSDHGVLHNVQRLDSAWVSMAEIFQGAGYRTAAFLSAGGIIRKNLSQGFDLVDDEVPVHEAVDWQRSATETNKRVLPWLDMQSTDPFFLWVHYYDPHTPMDATTGARAKAPGYRGRFCGGVRAEDGGYDGVDTLGAEDFAFLRLLYEEEVRAMDRAIGDLLCKIEEQGLADRTVVVIAGDHGESLGEKGYIGHDGDLLHEPLVHVPFLLRLPPAPRGVPGEPAGRPWLRRRVSESVGLCDILPTLLALLPGLGSSPHDLSGQSLLPFCARFSGGGAPDRIVFSEAPADLREGEIVPRRNFAARAGRWKLVSGPDGAALFDVRQDRREEKPVASGSEQTRRLGDELASWVASHSPIGQPTSTITSEPDDEVLEAMRALGYIK